MFDLVIKEGIVIDPSNKVHSLMDVAVEDGRIAALEEEISPSKARKAYSAAGRVVAPGLIDLHAHVFWGVSHYGIEPDRYHLGRGVTTVLDCGSSGAQNFQGFRSFVIERSSTRILALLNISAIGMPVRKVGELEDIRYADADHALETVEANRDLIIGIKVRLSRNVVGDNGLEPLKIALEAAERAGLPLMTHIGDTDDPLDAILPMLRKGDILTHAFHGRGHGILDERGEVLSALRDAVERGLHLDVGHGQLSFSLNVMEKALEQGVRPGTISSDLHYYNTAGPVYDQTTTLSKFLMLGMTLEDVIARSTVAPAKLLGREGKIGTLTPGAEADISILNLKEGEFTFTDSYGNTRKGRQLLEPTAVVRGGTLHEI